MKPLPHLHLLLLAASLPLPGSAFSPAAGGALSSSSSSSSPRLATTRLRPHLVENLEEAISEAQRICSLDPTSSECRVAWDIVEELEAKDSHTQTAAAAAAAAGAGAGAGELGTDYAVLMGSLDILLTKIDGKMDQLLATTDKMAQLGDQDPRVADVWEKAGALKEAVASLRARQ